MCARCHGCQTAPATRAAALWIARAAVSASTAATPAPVTVVTSLLRCQNNMEAAGNGMALHKLHCWTGWPTHMRLKSGCRQHVSSAGGKSCLPSLPTLQQVPVIRYVRGHCTNSSSMTTATCHIRARIKCLFLVGQKSYQNIETIVYTTNIYRQTAFPIKTLTLTDHIAEHEAPTLRDGIAERR